MKSFLNALSLFGTLSLITGIAYPFLITAVGSAFFPKQVSGSVVSVNGKVVGSILIAQPFDNEKYFWPRPSAADFNTVPSGGSNLSPTSRLLKENVDKRKSIFGQDAPAELLLASASGLDPHLSLAGALYQIPRISKARSLSEETVREIVLNESAKNSENFLGQRDLVNVLSLNLSLDGNAYED